MSKPEQVEEIKKIFEGLPTTINVKNKEPRVLERTPVLLTCNQVPWRFFSEEQETLQNRMFAFQNLNASPLLEGKKGANPKYFRWVFEYIHTEIANLPEFPCLPDDRHVVYVHRYGRLFRPRHHHAERDQHATSRIRGHPIQVPTS